jgi:hypothetical protein
VAPRDRVLLQFDTLEVSEFDAVLIFLICRASGHSQTMSASCYPKSPSRQRNAVSHTPATISPKGILETWEPLTNMDVSQIPGPISLMP